MLERYSFESFVERAVVGQRGEQTVVDLVRSWGFECEDATLTLRDPSKPAQIKEFTRNQTDLLVNGLSIEVKSRSLRFSDQPGSFPYSTIFVDTVPGWNAKVHKPDFYVFVSQQTSQVLVLDGKTSGHWQQKPSRDRGRGIVDRVFEAPREMLRTAETLRLAISTKR